MLRPSLGIKSASFKTRDEICCKFWVQHNIVNQINEKSLTDFDRLPPILEFMQKFYKFLQ